MEGAAISERSPVHTEVIDTSMVKELDRLITIDALSVNAM